MCERAYHGPVAVQFMIMRVIDVCVREPIMDPILDVYVREPIMDPVLDIGVREPIAGPQVAVQFMVPVLTTLLELLTSHGEIGCLTQTSTQTSK